MKQNLGKHTQARCKRFNLTDSAASTTKLQFKRTGFEQDIRNGDSSLYAKYRIANIRKELNKRYLDSIRKDQYKC